MFRRGYLSTFRYKTLGLFSGQDGLCPALPGQHDAEGLRAELPAIAVEKMVDYLAQLEDEKEPPKIH